MLKWWRCEKSTKTNLQKINSGNTRLSHVRTTYDTATPMKKVWGSVCYSCDFRQEWKYRDGERYFLNCFSYKFLHTMYSKSSHTTWSSLPLLWVSTKFIPAFIYVSGKDLKWRREKYRWRCSGEGGVGGYRMSGGGSNTVEKMQRFYSSSRTREGVKHGHLWIHVDFYRKKTERSFFCKTASKFLLSLPDDTKCCLVFFLCFNQLAY